MKTENHNEKGSQRKTRSKGDKNILENTPVSSSYPRGPSLKLGQLIHTL